MVNKLYYPFIGGVENHLYHLCNELSGTIGVSVLVCNTKLKTEIESENSVKIVRVASPGILFSMPLSFTFPLWLKKLADQSDIIHFHHPFPLGEFSSLLVQPKKKIVVTWHSDIIHQRFLLRLYRPFLLRFLERADLILPTSPNYIESSSFLRLFREKCYPVPLGIDLSQFKLTPKVDEQARKIRGRFGNNRPVILFIGRLIYYKGIEFLIEAMKEIDANLVIIGGGRLEARLKKQAAQPGLRSKIFFLKPVKDVELAAYYYACDLFVLPSVERSEGFGIVQLEAMACGKPVVSTDLPTGVPFANQHEKTGLVVPPRDPAALSKAINQLLSDAGLREKYGKYAQGRVKREFTKEVVAQRVLAVYKEMLEKPAESR